MDAERIAIYESLEQYLEPPIREIVPAIWRLPYVIDTGHTCSGHILAQPLFSYEEFSARYGWYPHRAILEVAYSEDPALETMRDGFRSDLKAVLVQDDRLKLFFDDVRARKRDKLPSHVGPSVLNLNEMYNATVPDELEKSDETVVRVESLLASFWEQIAAVVRKHNPKAKIGPIEGKDFRHVIDWDHWGTTLMRR